MHHNINILRYKFAPFALWLPSNKADRLCKRSSGNLEKMCKGQKKEQIETACNQLMSWVSNKTSGFSACKAKRADRKTSPCGCVMPRGACCDCEEMSVGQAGSDSSQPNAPLFPDGTAHQFESSCTELGLSPRSYELVRFVLKFKLFSLLIGFVFSCFFVQCTSFHSGVLWNR